MPRVAFRQLLMGLVLCACGEDASARVRLVPNVIAGVQVDQAERHDGVGMAAAPLRVGSTTAMRLQSLQYFVTSIQLCQDLERVGSGFSNPQGCIELYRNDEDLPDYQTYLVTQAKDDETEGRFVDLMTAEGQATLHKPVALEMPIADPEDAEKESGSQAGVYRFGLINFFRPIKVTAEFPVLGEPDQYFRTRAVTQIMEGRTVGGTFGSERVQIGDTRSGPTEQTTYMLNNGGTLFTFQKPFTVEQADVESGAEISVDLVFNPDSFGQAYENNGCDDVNIAICDPTNGVVIDMPYVHMSPVPRKAGEHTRKETYLVDYTTNAKLRVELYYNDADPQASVQGVDTAIVYTGEVSEPARNSTSRDFVSQSGSIETNDASVDLEDTERVKTLEGLLRRQNGTARISCQFKGPLCPEAGPSVERAYIYVGDTQVSVD